MTTSGTTAIILSLMALNLDTNDEVIVPNYTMIAIEKFGFWNGSILGFKRIWRCRPGGGQGNDPVPKEL